MLKGLALTPPVIGRISIGKVVEKDGRRLPEKDDEFTVTSQVQNREGWITHPIDETLRTSAGAKLRSIPVRLLFNDADLSLRANYTLFDRGTGRPMCVGNGETCKRSTSSGVQTLPCPSPEACEIATGGHCRPYGRLNVRIGDDDELGTYVFRTTGYNSIRTLSARLSYFHAVSGGLLSTLPLELRLRGKSTTQSHRAPIYYVDLTVQAGMSLADAIGNARTESESRQATGFDQGALDEAARQGFAAGAFEESDEEAASVVEEFFSDGFNDGRVDGSERSDTKPSLADKLNRRAYITATRQHRNWWRVICGASDASGAFVVALPGACRDTAVIAVSRLGKISQCPILASSPTTSCLPGRTSGADGRCTATRTRGAWRTPWRPRFAVEWEIRRPRSLHSIRAHSKRGFGSLGGGSGERNRTTVHGTESRSEP